MADYITCSGAGTCEYTASTWGKWVTTGGGYTTSASCIWPQWTVTLPAASTTYCGDVWPRWLTVGTSTATTLIWPQWTVNLEGAPAVVASPVQAQGTTHPYAVVEAVRQRQDDVERRYREEAAKHEFAEARARELLVAWLNPAQREEFAAWRHFHVIGKSGRRYRIDYGSHGNVMALDERGNVAERLCCNADRLGPIPFGDNVLAQKLALETDEEGFRKIANILRA